MKTLCLFTNQFPYKGGETFLETEIYYLSKSFDQVIIYPMSGFENELLPIPNNVKVVNYNIHQPVYLRKLVLNYGWVIAQWFILEIIKSPFRFKYISQFNWNFKRLVGLLNAAVGIKKELEKEWMNKDVKSYKIYTYWFNDWASILALANCIGLKKSFVTRVHLYDFEEAFYVRKYLPFRRTEMKYPEKILAISDYASNYLKNMFPQYAHKIYTNKLGVEDIGYNPIAEGNPYTIVSCSSLTWYKRPLKLVELISQLKVPIKWVHFGDGDMKDLFLDKTKELPDNIEFIWKGQVSNSVVTQFYEENNVDLLVNVSSFEGIPVSLMEAISFGIPIVGCNVCGQPEIVNNQTGLLLDSNFESSNAADKIQVFLLEKSRNQLFRSNVKGFWKDNFNAERNYTKFSNQLIIADSV